MKYERRVRKAGLLLSDVPFCVFTLVGTIQICTGKMLTLLNLAKYTCLCLNIVIKTKEHRSCNEIRLLGVNKLNKGLNP